MIRVQTNLSGEIRVEQTHDRSRQLGKHEIALRTAPEVHREIMTLNTEESRERIEEDMDFKIPGLPHSTVKQLQSASVRELIQKIYNHPNRHALQRDLQQSQSFNPFSQESKQMIHEVGNIELCELLDMEPKTQCEVCLSFWDIGIVYCTCGHFLRKGREENQNFVQCTMDLRSIPNNYIKRGRLQGHRFGKKPGDREYYIAHSLKKKCKKKNFLGIHDRFVRDEKFRKNMTDNGRIEESPKDDLADEDHTHHLTPEEIDDYRSNWWIRTNIIGSDTMPIRHRSDFRQALLLCDSEKTKKMKLNATKDGRKAILRLDGTGQDHGGFLLARITTKTYTAPIDQGNLIEEVIGTLGSRHDSLNSLALITVGSFAADGGLL